MSVKPHPRFEGAFPKKPSQPLSAGQNVVTFLFRGLKRKGRTRLWSLQVFERRGQSESPEAIGPTCQPTGTRCGINAGILKMWKGHK
jgi:hypothetical protein